MKPTMTLVIQKQVLSQVVPELITMQSQAFHRAGPTSHPAHSVPCKKNCRADGWVWQKGQRLCVCRPSLFLLVVSLPGERCHFIFSLLWRGFSRPDASFKSVGWDYPSVPKVKLIQGEQACCCCWPKPMGLESALSGINIMVCLPGCHIYISNGFPIQTGKWDRLCIDLLKC